MEQEQRERRVPPQGLGELIARGRMRTGLRGREAARLLGLDHGYLIQLETGRRTPSRRVAELLMEKFAFTERERTELFGAAIPSVGKDHPAKRAV